MPDYPVPPKPDDRPNASWAAFAEQLTGKEIEEMKNRDNRDPEEVARDEERNRCVKIIQKAIDAWMRENTPYKNREEEMSDIIKEIESGK